MNPPLFFENFELLADSPNGVQKLRELILQLAVMGKLIPQNQNDEPASFLSGKNTKSLKLVQEDEMPFDSPRGWIFSRMDQISNTIHYGYTASADDSLKDVRLLRITDIQNNKVNWETVPGCEIETQKLNGYALSNNDLLIARTGGTIGKSYLVENLVVRAVFASYLIRIIPNHLIFPKYLKLYADSPLYWGQLYSKCAGTGQPNVNATSLKSLIVPLPPLAEQKRIVSKVDELMELCDKLEARRQKKQEIQSKLNNAALEKMLNTENQEEFEQNWQRICENFDLLYDNPENVEKLKQAILQLAVQGKLVPQNPEDEPASVLIEKIRTERTVGKENKINKSEKYSAIDLDQKIFDTHSNWSWYKFAEIATIQSNLVSPANYPDLPHIAPNNIEKGTGKLLEYTTVAEDGVTSPKHYFYSGQLLYSKIRPNLSKVVIASFEGLCSADMYPIKSHIDTKYLYLYILSETFLMQVTGNDNRVAMPKVNQQQLSNVLVPLPPLAEQKRIVEKIKQLMGLCDELELKLRKEREDSGKLMETVVKGLLEGAAAQK